MTNLQIQLDPIALREATTQAIVGILTPEMREQILQKAIASLLVPSTDNWNKGKNSLEQAFEQAVQGIVRQYAMKMVAEDAEISNKIKTLLRETADKVLSADTEKLTERMADAFVVSMRKDY